jgi:hypothetical protein
MRQTSILAVALLATTFLTGSHCGNEITAPLATPTPAPPTPTRTPAPATLSGQVLTGTQPYSGAQIGISQGSKVFGTTSASDGSYTITGLLSGPAILKAIQARSPDQLCAYFSCTSGDVSLTLRPGSNRYVIGMKCSMNPACP